MSGNLIVATRPNYLDPKDRIIFDIPIGGSLGQIADALCITPEARACLIVQLEGHVIPSNMWDHVTPKEGTRVEVFPAYRGDSGKAILGAVAMIALSLVTFGVGGYVGLAYVIGGGMGTMGVAVVGAGIMLLGALAVSALYPPPEAPPEAGEAGSHYSLAGVANRPRPDGAMMLICGKIKVFPDVIALPYLTNVEGDEYLTAIYGYGYANVDREDVYVGNVRVEEMEPPHAWVQYRSFTSTDPLYIYPDDVHQEAMDIVLVNDRQDTAWELHPPEDDQWRYFQTEKYCDEVNLHFFFPQGCWKVSNINDDGKKRTELAIWIYYKNKGGSTWYNMFGLNGNTVFNYPTGNSKNSIQWQSISGEDTAVVVDFNTFTPFALSMHVTMPWQGQFEFKMGRSDYPGGNPDIDDVADHNKTIFRAVQTITKERPIDPPVPLSISERRFMATDQLSGTVDNLSAICTAYVPYLDASKAWLNPVWTSDGAGSGTWNNPYKSNHAWVYLNILKGDANPAPLVDDDIDLDAFIAWAEYCDQDSPRDATKPFLECNFVSTGYETVDQMLQKVAAAGNAAKHIRDGKHSIIFDAAAPHATQIFTQRNTSGFSMVKNFIKMPHGIKVKFNDEDNDYKEEVVIAYSPGYDEDNATDFEEMSAFACTEEGQALRAGLRYLAMGRYRFEEFSFTTDIENIASERGDRIRISYDSVDTGGAVGRIMEVYTDGAGDVTGVKLDQKHGGTIHIRANLGLMIRSLDTISAQPVSHVWTPTVSALPTDYEVTFDSAVSPTTLEIEVGNIAVFGEIEEITDDFLIKTITPGPDLTANIVCENYAVEIQYIENGGVVVGDDEPTITRQPIGGTFTVGDVTPLMTIIYMPTYATIQWQYRNIRTGTTEWEDIDGATSNQYPMPLPYIVAEHDDDEFRAGITKSGYPVAYSDAAYIIVT